MCGHTLLRGRQLVGLHGNGGEPRLPFPELVGWWRVVAGVNSHATLIDCDIRCQLTTVVASVIVDKHASVDLKRCSVTSWHAVGLVVVRAGTATARSCLFQGAMSAGVKVESEGRTHLTDCSLGGLLSTHAAAGADSDLSLADVGLNVSGGGNKATAQSCRF